MIGPFLFFAEGGDQVTGGGGERQASGTEPERAGCCDRAVMAASVPTAWYRRRATALSIYHCVLCAAHEAIDPPARELLEYFSEEQGTVPVELRRARDTPSNSRQRAAVNELRAYSLDVFLVGPLENCAEFPLMALRLVASNIVLVRAAGGETLLGRPFSSAMCVLFGGLAPFARMEKLPVPALLDCERIQQLIAVAVGMDDAERAWVGLDAIAMLMGVLFSNAIRVFPRTPFDSYMGKLRRVDDAHARAAAMERVWAAVACATVTERGEGAARPSASELDALMRRQCAFGVGALFRLHPKINHCCDANTQAESYQFENAMIQIPARRAIKRSEQLSLSYTSTALTNEFLRRFVHCSQGLHLPMCVRSDCL
jgi:hypothetical protein